MVSFEGYGESMATFIANSDVAKGAPVKVSGNGTVSAAASGDEFCGIAKSVRNGCTAVQLAGYMRVAYTGTAPDVGYRSFVSNGGGGVQVSASGKKALVVDVEPETSSCGIIV